MLSSSSEESSIERSMEETTVPFLDDVLSQILTASSVFESALIALPGPIPLEDSWPVLPWCGEHVDEFVSRDTDDWSSSLLEDKKSTLNRRGVISP